MTTPRFTPAAGFSVETRRLEFEAGKIALLLSLHPKRADALVAIAELHGDESGELLLALDEAWCAAVHDLGNPPPADTLARRLALRALQWTATTAPTTGSTATPSTSATTSAAASTAIAPAVATAPPAPARGCGGCGQRHASAKRRPPPTGEPYRI